MYARYIYSWLNNISFVRPNIIAILNFTGKKCFFKNSITSK